MSAPIDCPICMDRIESTTRNYVTTECGHCFHANCLMTSVAHNGFGCPYCRTAMAEVPEEDDESVWSDEDDDEDEEEDDIMRGFRFFWNNIHGEPHDEEDEDDEDEYDEYVVDHDISNRVNRGIPSTDFVAQKLLEQGVTFEQLVKLMCHYDYQEYYSYDEESERLGGEIYDKVRRILDNYTPEQVVVPHHPEPVVEVQPEPEPRINFEAQPKLTKVSFIRRLECC